MPPLGTFAVNYYTNSYYSYNMDPGTFFVYLIVTVLVIAGIWRMFDKAKQPGWAAIVPIYNTVILLKVANRPLWWILLFLIPIVNFVIYIVVANDIAKSFGKGAGTTLLLVFLPFIGYPMLGFGEAKYKKPKN